MLLYVCQHLNMIMQFHDPTPDQLKHLQEWCTIKAHGNHMIQMYINDQQQWKIQGNVYLARVPDDGACPVQFDSVSGSFVANNMGLATCKNLPRSLGANLRLAFNQLRDLADAPAQVEGNMELEGNPLVSLEGMPLVQGWVNITYSRDLPLLRLLTAKLGAIILGAHTPTVVRAILKKYMGQGKTAMLNCALELKKAGYAENARW